MARRYLVVVVGVGVRDGVRDGVATNDDVELRSENAPVKARG